MFSQKQFERNIGNLSESKKKIVKVVKHDNGNGAGYLSQILG